MYSTTNYSNNFSGSRQKALQAALDSIGKTNPVIPFEEHEKEINDIKSTPSQQVISAFDQALQKKILEAEDAHLSADKALTDYTSKYEISKNSGFEPSKWLFFPNLRLEHYKNKKDKAKQTYENLKAAKKFLGSQKAKELAAQYDKDMAAAENLQDSTLDAAVDLGLTDRILNVFRGKAGRQKAFEAARYKKARREQDKLTAAYRKAIWDGTHGLIEFSRRHVAYCGSMMSHNFSRSYPYPAHYGYYR